MERLWSILRILVVLIVFALFTTPVLAAEVNVTVTARPAVTGGIANFTITYVSETQLDFSWTLTGDATKIMIRGKYGGYPDNIPDQFTTPSDGYLVYYGDATSCSDITMDFDENPGPIYYTAWAQKADDTWHTDISTGQKESEILLLIGLILLAMGFTISSVVLKKGYLAFAGAGSWMVIAIYCFGKSTENWDIYFSLAWLFLGLLLASVFSPLAWRETTIPGERTEDPDTTAMREEMENWNRERSQYSFLYSNKSKRGKTRFQRTSEE